MHPPQTHSGRRQHQQWPTLLSPRRPPQRARSVSVPLVVVGPSSARPLIHHCLRSDARETIHILTRARQPQPFLVSQHPQCRTTCMSSQRLSRPLVARTSPATPAGLFPSCLSPPDGCLSVPKLTFGNRSRKVRCQQVPGQDKASPPSFCGPSARSTFT